MLSKMSILLNIMNTILIIFILSVLYGKNNTITETSSVKPYFDTVLSINNDIKNKIKDINGIKPILNDKSFNAPIGQELEANKNTSNLSDNDTLSINGKTFVIENKQTNQTSTDSKQNDLDKNIAIVEEQLKEKLSTDVKIDTNIAKGEVKQSEVKQMVSQEEYIQRETIQTKDFIPLLITFEKVANTKLKGNMKIMVAKNKTYDYYKLRYKDQDFLIHSKYIK